MTARQKRPTEAIELFHKLFLALREDARATRYVVGLALTVAVQLGEQNPTLARPLYESLEQPLALYMLDDRRRGIRLVLGQRLGSRENLSTLLDLEPFPPWEATILQNRVHVYQKVNHPYFARARRELNKFSLLSTEPAVLVMPAGKEVGSFHPDSAPAKSAPAAGGNGR
jgi:hypothetical protein